MNRSFLTAPLCNSAFSHKIELGHACTFVSNSADVSLISHGHFDLLSTSTQHCHSAALSFGVTRQQNVRQRVRPPVSITARRYQTEQYSAVLEGPVRGTLGTAPVTRSVITPHARL